MFGLGLALGLYQSGAIAGPTPPPPTGGDTIYGFDVTIYGVSFTVYGA